MKDFYEKYYKKRKDDSHLYEDGKPKRLHITADIINNQSNYSVLDIGCGEGSLGELINERISLYGVDISETALRMADEHYTATYQMNIEDGDILNSIKEKPDVVVLLDVLQHLFQPSEFLGEVVENLPPSTTFIISVPNFVNWENRLDILKGDLPTAYTLYDSSEHISHFTPEILEELLNSVGLKINKTRYIMNYPFHYIFNYIGFDILSPSLGSRHIIAICEV